MGPYHHWEKELFKNTQDVPVTQHHRPHQEQQQRQQQQLGRPSTTQRCWWTPWMIIWSCIFFILFVIQFKMAGLGHKHRCRWAFHWHRFLCPQPCWRIAQGEVGCKSVLFLKIERWTKSISEEFWWLLVCVENYLGKDHEKMGTFFLVFTKPVLDAQGSWVTSKLSRSTW